MVGMSTVLTLAVLAEGRIPADRQPQSGVRHRVAAAGLQPRRTDEDGRDSRREVCARIGTSIRTARKPQKLDYPVIGDFFFVARGRQVFMGLRAYDPMRAAELVPLLCDVGADRSARRDCRRQAIEPVRARPVRRPHGRRRDHRPRADEAGRSIGGQVIGQVMQLIPEGAGRFPSRASTCRVLKCTSSRSWCRRPTWGSARTDLGFAVNALVDGAYVSDYYLDGKKIDLTVHGRRSLCQDDAGHRGAADRHAARVSWCRFGALADVELVERAGADQPSRAASGRSRFKSRRRPTMPLEDAMITIQNKIVAAAVAQRPARRRLSHQPGRHGRQAPRHVAGAAVQHPAGLRDHVPVDGRAVRVVALSVRDHLQRAAGGGRRLARACGCLNLLRAADARRADDARLRDPDRHGREQPDSDRASIAQPHARGRHVAERRRSSNRSARAFGRSS